ncbi:methyltransferase domain-containing protein [Limnospira fusiformis]|uniref:methyltransferase domain-containing protein n=1 Tax=Limnospira fusiformis TaxID=54297 RepID=UPI002AA1EBC8|nr:glycosyltransferase [Limnospira fusiformis LS22]
MTTLDSSLKCQCKICGSESYFLGKGKVLNKYDVDYFQCSNCQFVQTEEPFWLDEAYSEAISTSDVGLVYRNMMLEGVAKNLIFNYFDHAAQFLDYGGGYGLFVRLMRDAGFDFYWSDKFCDNIFAKGFEFESSEKGDIAFELVTAFEVFEHLVNPISEIEKILKYSQNILFTTELLPNSNPKPDEWWYYVLHEGQHISLYTLKSLSVIATKYNLNLYSDGRSRHLMTAKELPQDLFEKLYRGEFKSPNRESLLNRDFAKVVQKINQNSPIFSQSLSNTLEGLAVSPKILIDGVFFQLYRTGIARVWRTLLEEWANTEFAAHIIVLDRANSAPKIPGIRYLTIPAYSYNNADADKQMLQQVCDQEGADLFISTYYTTPLSTPSVFMAYDMIPEVLGGNLDQPMWREKHHAISHACSYAAISESTARDLVKFFPDISIEQVTVAHCGVAPIFTPATATEISTFQHKYGISKPYFLLVGAGSNYKNAILFFRAFNQLHTKQGFEIICTGSGVTLANEYRQYTSGTVVHSLTLSDEELKIAYSGAVALVYPSLYEGFGMPVLEALACGCPVITCANASIPEVAGEAAIYVDANDVDGLTDALCEVQKSSVRNSLITAGLTQAKQFSWVKMAEIMSSALIQVTLARLNLQRLNFIIFPDWSQPEETVGLELQAVIKTLVNHPDKAEMTLLIDNSNITPEEADLVLSSVAMNLLMEEEIEFDGGPEIVLIGELSPMQWSALMSKLQGRIKLDHENQEVINNLKADIIPVVEPDNN